MICENDPLLGIGAARNIIIVATPSGDDGPSDWQKSIMNLYA